MSRSFVYLMSSFSPSPIPVSPSESVTKSPPYVTKSHACVTKSHACLPVTLSSSYPVIPLSPVTHRTCSSVTLSFITINLSTCLLANLSTYSLTLSPSYPVIPLFPVTHRTCTSVTLSFIAPTCVPLSPRRPVLRPTVYYMFTLFHYVILSKHVILSLCLKPFTPSKHVIMSLCLKPFILSKHVVLSKYHHSV